MAIDYYHRLVFIGPPALVRSLAAGLRRVYPRTVGDRTWTEDLPFSFVSLYALAPGARRVFDEPPGECFDISAWSPRRISARRWEVRYQLHTRNLELQALVQELSRSQPGLDVHLATMCLDDADAEVFRFRRGRVARWSPPAGRLAQLRAAATRKFGKTEEELDEIGGPDSDWAELRLFDEAIRHWARPGPRSGWQWWNRPSSRDLDDERDLALIELAPRRPRKASPGTRKPRRGRGRHTPRER